MSPTPIERFLIDLDAHWAAEGPRIPLKVLGSTALMLQADYLRGTKDSDVLGVDPVTGIIETDLLALAGKDTMHRRHKVYLDVVGSGVPFLPRPCRWNPMVGLNAILTKFEIHALDITDVVTSKLKRFADNDRTDIRAMVDLDLVDHAQLVERFLSAADAFSMDARAHQLVGYARNLNWVEREYLGVPETDYELPPWTDA